MSGEDLVAATGHTAANISRLKRGKVRAVRFSTLFAICDVLDCSPGDILVRVPEEAAGTLEKGVYIIDLPDDD